MNSKRFILNELMLKTISDLNGYVLKYGDDLFKEEMQLMHFENYSFKGYLLSFLNDKYPDRYAQDLFK